MMKIKYIVFPVVLISIVCFSCKSKIEQKGKGKEPIAISNELEIEGDTAIEKWKYYYNIKSDSIQYLYGQNSIKIFESGKVLSGRGEIKDTLLKSTLEIMRVDRDTMILANKERAIEYEIIENIYGNNERKKALIIWQTKENDRLRVFEFESKKVESETSNLEIDKRRSLWISLCNEHKIEELINELYSENTLYYNHKPIVKGREALEEEYGYMKSDNYSLSLQPEIVEQVNERIIFEIGQCSGSYKGKYILIWRKDEDGLWRILVDSNI